MSIFEITDRSVPYSQLLDIAAKGNYEENDLPYYAEYDHPLLKTSRLVGFVTVKDCEANLGARLRITHRVPRNRMRHTKISTSSIHLDEHGTVGITLKPNKKAISALNDHMDELLYAKETYLPKQLIEAYAKVKGEEQVESTLPIEDTPELLDFIQATATNV